MEKLISNEGRVGYRYNEGERPDIDAFVDRLSKFGLPKDYLYESIFELREVTDNFDYNGYDKERIERLGYPADWLRRCGLHPGNMKDLPDEAIISHCATLKSFDEKFSLSKIVFTSLEIPENTPFDSSAMDYDNVPEMKTSSNQKENEQKEDVQKEYAPKAEEQKKESIFTKIGKLFKKENK